MLGGLHNLFQFVVPFVEGKFGNMLWGGGGNIMDIRQLPKHAVTINELLHDFVEVLHVTVDVHVEETGSGTLEVTEIDSKY